jgi:hypothetical protein
MGEGRASDVTRSRRRWQPASKGRHPRKRVSQKDAEYTEENGNGSKAGINAFRKLNGTIYRRKQR